jgi:hypothetical protein
VLLARRVPQLTAIAEKIEAAGHAKPHICPPTCRGPTRPSGSPAELTARNLETGVSRQQCRATACSARRTRSTARISSR